MSAIVPVGAIVPGPFRNEYLSVSRLKLYESCPRAFWFRYVAKAERSSGPEANLAPRFGSLLHETMEDVYRWVVAEEHVGPLPEGKIVEFYRMRWHASNLSGLSLFQEGLKILRSYARTQGDVDHWKVLGVEVAFDLEVEGFSVVGRIDRADKVDDETVRIVDLKSNRLLFSSNDVETDLQMGVYAMAARKLWPWATKVELCYHMLRHDIVQSTERLDAHLEEVSAYISLLGRRTESDTEYLPVVGPNCVYCDYSGHCSAFHAAMESGKEAAAWPETEELERIAEAREKVATLAKFFYKRQKDFDDIIRAHLEHHDELDLAGKCYRLSYPKSYEYAMDQTVELICRSTGMSFVEVVRAILVVDSGKLERLLDSIGGELGKSRMLILQAELKQAAKQVPMSPRLISSKSKRPSGGAKAPMLKAATEGGMFSVVETSAEETEKQL